MTHLTSLATRHLPLATLFATLLAMPAMAKPDTGDRKKLPEYISPEDITRQETIALGNNRFLIFSGTAGENKSYGYTVDLVKIENGIPRFEPLFMEEYDAGRNAARLEYGVAFFAQSYHYDKNAGTLDYTFIDPDDKTRTQYKFKLDVDILKLQEVVTQDKPDCAQPPCKPPLPKVVFNAKDLKNASDKAAMAPAASGKTDAESTTDKESNAQTH